jgi:hypothetical protein
VECGNGYACRRALSSNAFTLDAAQASGGIGRVRPGVAQRL